MNWSMIASYLLNRLKENTTWAGIFSVLTGIGIAIKPELWDTIATVGAGLAGAALTLLPNTMGSGGTPTPPAS